MHIRQLQGSQSGFARIKLPLKQQKRMHLQEIKNALNGV